MHLTDVPDHINQQGISSILYPSESINNTHQTIVDDKEDAQINSKSIGPTTFKPEPNLKLTWNCSVCTFENDMKDYICIMCDQGVHPQLMQEKAESKQQPVPQKHESIPSKQMPQSRQTELILKLIRDTIKAKAHSSPLLSTALDIERMLISLLTVTPHDF